MSKKETAALFDMDGVIVDTEPQYDVLWKAIRDEYVPAVNDLEKKIKGTALPDILEKYFAHYSGEVRQDIAGRVDRFERSMDFFEIPGAVGFIRKLKEKGIPAGLVSSSGDEKVKLVIEKLKLDGLLDTIVSAGRILKGKPDPECYLLAAADLSVDPSACYVFEDSIAGIQAGTAAGMKVVGLSTTLLVKLLKKKATHVISDFRNFTPEKMLGLKWD
jgi:HAD superfamily hydrolase (TIGR01509 family)